MTSGLGVEIRFVDIEPRGVVPCRTSYLATARGPRIDMAHVPANACSRRPHSAIADLFNVEPTTR